MGSDRTECTALSTVGFIPVGARHVAMVDANDLPRLSQTCWTLQQSRAGPVYANSRGGMMHRLLTDTPNGKFVDHINGMGLDNRRANLRTATHQENMRNRVKRRRMSSRFKGVYYEKNRATPWRASMSVNRQTVRLGSYLSEEEAARAYDAAAIHLYGQFARVNFPDTPSDLSAIKLVRDTKTSRFKGVHWAKSRRKWQATAPRRRFLGYFNCEEEAARAYDAAMRELHGDCARLNFPTSPSPVPTHTAK